MGKNLYETPRDKAKWNRNVEPLHPVKKNNKTSRSKRLEQLKDRFAKQQKNKEIFAGIHWINPVKNTKMRIADL